jgi:phytoene dehydrogenase-like protein
MVNRSQNKSALLPVDIAIIGAGLAGMSAAVYARKAGFSVRVFEKHFLPGGLCTAWKRNGYVFDYCYHYFFGCGKKHALYPIWKELGVIDAVNFQHMSIFSRYTSSDGKELNLYTNHKRLEEHLISIAPEDAKQIKAFCKAIHTVRNMQIADLSLDFENIRRIIKAIPAIVVMNKWANITTREWCGKLKNQFLREAFPPLIGYVDFPMSAPILAFALMDNDSIGYPVGGSLPISLTVEKKAKSLGAEFEYKAEVTRIIAEKGIVSGIELDDGRIQRATHVIAASDAHAAFEKLLEGKVRNPVYTDMFATAERHPSLVQVSLGVTIDPKWALNELPQMLILKVKNPIRIDTTESAVIHLQNYAGDPSMAPSGGTPLIVRHIGDYDYWNTLLKDDNAYKAEKNRILKDTIQALEEHFPGIHGNVVVSDVATPTTCVRYTSNYRGSMQGWVLTKELMKKIFSGKRPPKYFTELKNFYLIGQWKEPGGGTPPVVRSGRDIIKFIQKKR